MAAVSDAEPLVPPLPIGETWDALAWAMLAKVGLADRPLPPDVLVPGAILHIGGIDGLAIEPPLEVVVVDAGPTGVVARVLCDAEDRDRVLEYGSRRAIWALVASSVEGGVFAAATARSIEAAQDGDGEDRLMAELEWPHAWTLVDERRRPRRAVHVQAYLHHGDDDSDATCVDVSSGGCRLHLAESAVVAAGDSVTVEFADGMADGLRVAGAVVAVREAHGLPQMVHVMFDGLTDTERHWLNALE